MFPLLPRWGQSSMCICVRVRATHKHTHLRVFFTLQISAEAPSLQSILLTLRLPSAPPEPRLPPLQGLSSSVALERIEVGMSTSIHDKVAGATDFCEFR